MKACSGRLRCHLVSAQILCRSGQGKRQSAARNSCQEYERVLQRKQLRRNSDPWSTTTPAESRVFWRRGIPARASNWPSDASCYMRMRAAVFCALQRIRTQRSALNTGYTTQSLLILYSERGVSKTWVLDTCIHFPGFGYTDPGGCIGNSLRHGSVYPNLAWRAVLQFGPSSLLGNENRPAFVLLRVATRI